MEEIVGIFFISFLAGISTTFQPCLFPLLPTYFSFMTNTNDTGRQSFMNSIYLTSGIILIFSLLAIFVKISFLGLSSFLFRYTVEFNFIMAIFLVILALTMISGVSMPLSSRVQQFSYKFLEKYKDNNFTSFILGVAYSLMAAPCAAPIFLALIPLINVINPTTALFAMMTYSIGAGLPFIFVGLILPEMRSNFTNRVKNISKYMKNVSGTILLLMSYFLLNNYVFPYYPIRVGDMIFWGINSDLLTQIYVIILGIPAILLVVMLVVLVLYTRVNKNKNLILNN
ncbi:MAG: cytochrome c biogenesis CcdA family protein [Candidatus Hodarchaeales archaeon]|jgi:cytochrome c-type biogenesis protein